MSGGHNSSDEESKIQEALNLSDKKDRDSSSSKATAAASTTTVAAVPDATDDVPTCTVPVAATAFSDDESAVPGAISALAAAYPILYRLLCYSLAQRHPLLVEMLENIPDEDWISKLKKWDREYPVLEEQDLRRSLIRKSKSVSDTRVNKPESDEDAPPAKKPLLDASVREKMSPQKSQNLSSEPRQAAANVSIASTSNSSKPSGNDDSMQHGTDSTGRKKSGKELNGVKPPSFPRTQVQNILPFFACLLRRISELETFLDKRHGTSDGPPAEEAVAGPSTYSDRQLPSTSKKFAAEETPAAPSTKEIEPPKTEGAAVQENTIGNSLGETSDSIPKSKAIPILRFLNEEVQNCVLRCIETTGSVLNICLQQGTDRLLTEVESYVDGILDMLDHLVQVRKQCNGLRQRCLNPNDKSGVIYVLKVTTALTQAYNRLMKNILALDDPFHESVQSSSPVDSDV